ncbi:MAG: 3'(2'),5'-bisphosphate nucleotidase CysQ [Rhizobiaceae bacterium]
MSKLNPDLMTDLELLAEVSAKAGEIALGYFRAANKVWTKKGDSPVSEADFEVDAFLKQELLGARPEYGWLSEETTDNEDRLARKNVFVVDPIDGTRGFINGDIHWCISIAIVRHGIPVGAVLECPAVERTFMAAAGSGAKLNGSSLQPKADDKIRSLTASRKVNEAINSQFPGRFEIAPYIPSLAYRVASVATGEVDGAFARGGAHEWDLAAADLILSEAGGRLTDNTGSAITYNAPRIRAPALVISGPGKHAALLDLANSGHFLH